MNYIAALTLSRKIVLLQFLSDRGMKTFENFSYGNFSPSPILSYAITKKPKKKPWWVLKLLRVLRDRVLFRVLSDSVLFRFLGDLVFFRSLSDRVLFMVLSYT